MGWMANQHRIRRERVAKLIREGCSDQQMLGRGYTVSVIARMREETGIKNPGEYVTAREAMAAAKRVGLKAGPRTRLFGKAGRAKGKDGRDYYIDDK